MSVPTYGAVLLSADMKKVLLVQSYWAKNSWSFPKGKVNENEEPIECAVREVNKIYKMAYAATYLNLKDETQ